VQYQEYNIRETSSDVKYGKNQHSITLNPAIDEKCRRFSLPTIISQIDLLLCNNFLTSNSTIFRENNNIIHYTKKKSYFLGYEYTVPVYR